MRSLLVTVVAAAAVANALPRPAEEVENPATQYLTQTNSDGVVTGQPAAATLPAHVTVSNGSWVPILPTNEAAAPSGTNKPEEGSNGTSTGSSPAPTDDESDNENETESGSPGTGTTSSASSDDATATPVTSTATSTATTSDEEGTKTVTNTSTGTTAPTGTGANKPTGSSDGDDNEDSSNGDDNQDSSNDNEDSSNGDDEESNDDAPGAAASSAVSYSAFALAALVGAATLL